MELLRSSIKQQVYEIIKEKILRQEYGLGQSINIAALSAQLAISNTPIREALAQLEAEGLVTPSLHAKYKVITLTDKDLAELNQTIQLLCCGALDLCIAAKRTDHLIRLLRAAIDSQKQNTKTSDGDLLRTAISFDEAMLKATENAMLTDIFHRLSCKLLLSVQFQQQNSYSRNDRIEAQEHIRHLIQSGEVEDAKERLSLYHSRQICPHLL